MLIAILLISLFVFIGMGLPIAIALSGSSLLYILVGHLTGEVSIPEVVVIHRIVNGVDSFPLLAVPFFIFAGNLMNTSGITKRIYDFALAVVGWMRGGLGARERHRLGDLRRHVGHRGRRRRRTRHHRNQGHARSRL